MLGGVTLESFKIIGDRNIGRGTYGEVKLVERDGKKYAMKLLDKEQITRVSTNKESLEIANIINTNYACNLTSSDIIIIFS